jgi:hypothetical protein
MRLLAAALVAAAAALAVAQQGLQLPNTNKAGKAVHVAPFAPRGLFNAHAVDEETAAALKAVANRIASHRSETHEEPTLMNPEEVVVKSEQELPVPRQSRDLSDEEMLRAVQELAGSKPAKSSTDELTSPAVTEQYNEIAETLKRRRLCSSGQYYTRKKGKWFKGSVRTELLCALTEATCTKRFNAEKALSQLWEWYVQGISKMRCVHCFTLLHVLQVITTPPRLPVAEVALLVSGSILVWE